MTASDLCTCENQLQPHDPIEGVCPDEEVHWENVDRADQAEAEDTNGR